MDETTKEKRGFTIIELLEEVGVDNLKFQILSECLEGTQSALPKKSRRKGSKLSFGTEEELGSVAFHFKRDALVVWMDRDKLEEAHAALKAKFGTTEKETDDVTGA